MFGGIENDGVDGDDVADSDGDAWRRRRHRHLQRRPGRHFGMVFGRRFGVGAGDIGIRSARPEGPKTWYSTDGSISVIVVITIVAYGASAFSPRRQQHDDNGHDDNDNNCNSEGE